MQYVKSASYHSEWKGADYSKEEIQVVPDQSLSLEEILERFVRHEELPIGKDASWDDDEENQVDWEKIQHLDITEKMEYIEAIKETQAKYLDEKRSAEEKERIRLEQEAWEEAVKKAAEKLKEGSPAK